MDPVCLLPIALIFDVIDFATNGIHCILMASLTVNTFKNLFRLKHDVPHNWIIYESNILLNEQ